MARIWERHNHRNPCPVCDETKKGCRTNTETNVTHCRGDNPSPAYRFLKEDKHGFAMYKLEEEISNFSEARKQEWLEEKRLEKERREREWQQQLEAGLSPQERDRAIKAILSQLSLTDEDREKLQARGLTDSQIKEAGYRSVSQWQPLTEKVTPALAGVNRYGNKLITPDSGILIPVPDENGLWVGYQVRRDNPEDGNKYIWSASERKRDPRPTVHTKDGELPLGVWGEASQDGVVGLCESPGIKPYIASLRLEIPFIGAAGNNFASSPKALQRGLEALEAKKIIIYPDAGTLQNTHILKQLKDTIALLKEWGYQDISIAWWQQIEKSNGDIDEISQDTEIKLITAFEFLAKAKKAQRDRFFAENTKTSDKEKIARLTQLTQVDKRINRQYFDPSDLDDMPKDCPLVFLIGHQGVGKSVLAKVIALQAIKEGKASFGITHRRLLSRSMARNWDIPYVEDTKGASSPNGFTFVINSMYLESQAQFSPDDERLKGATIFFDEFDQVLDAAFNDSTMEDKRCLILQNLIATIDRVVSSGGKCIFASADLYDYHRDFIENIFNQQYGFPPKVWTLKNDYNPVAQNECELIFYDDPEADKTPAGIYADTLNVIAQGKKVLLQSTSQKVTSPYGTRTIEADLKKRFPDLRILRWDSQTNNDPNHEAFGLAERLAKDPTILDQYDVVIVSPVLEIGVSIDDPNGHFDLNVDLHNSGDQDTRTIKHSVRRLRPLVPRWVYVAPRSNRKIGSGATSPKEVIRDTHKQIQKLKGQLVSAQISQGDDDYQFEANNLFLKPWAMSAALKNIDFANYRDRARKALEDIGYALKRTSEGNNLEYSVGYEARDEELRETRDDNKESHFERVLAFPNPDDERYEALQAQNEKTQQEQLEQEKGFISRAYGVTPTYELIQKHNEDSGWLQKLKLHYHLTVGSDYLSEKEKKQLQALSEDTGKIFAPEAVKRSRLLKIYWLKEFGIDLFLEESADFTEGSYTDKTLSEADLNAWYQAVIERDRELKKNLGISVWGKTKDGYELVKPKTLADRLLALVDMSLTTQRKRDGKGNRINEYCPTRIAKKKEHNLLTLKADIFQSWLEKDHHDQEGDKYHSEEGGDQKFPYIYKSNSGIFGQGGESKATAPQTDPPNTETIKESKMTDNEYEDIPFGDDSEDTSQRGEGYNLNPPTSTRTEKPLQVTDYRLGELVWFINDYSQWSQGYVVQKNSFSVRCHINPMAMGGGKWIWNNDAIAPGTWILKEAG